MSERATSSPVPPSWRPSPLYGWPSRPLAVIVLSVTVVLRP